MSTIPQPAPQVPSVNGPKTILLIRTKECKHSVVFSTSDPEAAVQSVYVMRKAFPNMPQAFELVLNPR